MEHNIDAYFRKLYKLGYFKEQLIDKMIENYHLITEEVEMPSDVSIFPMPGDQKQSTTLYWVGNAKTFRITSTYSEDGIENKWTLFDTTTKESETGTFPEERAFYCASKLVNNNENDFQVFE